MGADAVQCLEKAARQGLHVNGVMLATSKAPIQQSMPSIQISWLLKHVNSIYRAL